MSGVIGLFLLVWAIFAGIGVLAGGIVFGTALDDNWRRDAKYIIGVSLVWPFWIAVQVGRALRWPA